MAPPLTKVADIQLQLTTHLSTPKGWKAELAWGEWNDRVALHSPPDFFRYYICQFHFTNIIDSLYSVSFAKTKQQTR